MVLLSVLHIEGEAYAVSIRRGLQRRAGGSVARGALYNGFARAQSHTIARLWY
jgi:hypothetical protein